MGTHQDLTGGHEAKSLLIADSERMAHCGPSLIAPIAEYGRSAVGAPTPLAAHRTTGSVRVGPPIFVADCERGRARS